MLFYSIIVLEPLEKLSVFVSVSVSADEGCAGLGV
jgi:hypothetical protein